MVKNARNSIARAALALTLAASSLASSNDDAQYEAVTVCNNLEICHCRAQLQLEVTLPDRQHSEKILRYRTTYSGGGSALRQAIAINPTVQKTPTVDKLEMVSTLLPPEDASSRLHRVAATTVAVGSVSARANSGSTPRDSDQVQAVQIIKGTALDSNLILDQPNTRRAAPFQRRNDLRLGLPAPVIDPRVKTWIW